VPLGGQAEVPGVGCLAVSASLGLLATGGGDGSLRIWDLEYLSLEAAVRRRRASTVTFLLARTHGLTRKDDLSLKLKAHPL